MGALYLLNFVAWEEGFIPSLVPHEESP